MADQKINALPTKTSPTTGDKVLMSGAAEEYLIDYDQLATAILNKLTSKTYTLDQGTKTLVAALNELNSKTLVNSSIGSVDAVSKTFDLKPYHNYMFAYTRLGSGNIASDTLNVGIVSVGKEATSDGYIQWILKEADYGVSIKFSDGNTLQITVTTTANRWIIFSLTEL